MCISRISGTIKGYLLITISICHLFSIVLKAEIISFTFSECKLCEQKHIQSFATVAKNAPCYAVLFLLFSSKHIVQKKY